MPMIEIPPELFVEHQGVAVYRTYDGDDDVNAWHYTTDPGDSNSEWPDGESQFDVRDLPPGVFDVNDPATHETIIRTAIATGLVCGEPAIERGWSVATVRIEVVGQTVKIVEAPPWVEVVIVTDKEFANEGVY